MKFKECLAYKALLSIKKKGSFLHLFVTWHIFQLPLLYNTLALTRGGEGSGGGGVNLVYNGQIFQRENIFGALCM